LSVEEVFQVAAAIIASVGGAAVIFAVLSAWIGKIWANRLMQRDIARHQEDLERLKSELKRLESEHSVRFARLHERQAEVIASLYEKLYQFNIALHRLLFEYQHREIREDLDRRFYLNKREEWILVPGIHTLRPEESERIDEVSKAATDIHVFYGTRKLYLPASCCTLMDRLSSLAAFVATSYQNIALKDNDGNLLVHPDVKRVWDAAIQTIPQLLAELEKEFRLALGAAD